MVVLARRGGRYPVAAPAVAVGLAGRLRCGTRATRAAAMPRAAALNGPPLHGFSPVRSLPARTSTARLASRACSPGTQESAGTLACPGSPPRVTPLLAAPQVAATGYRPPRSTTGGVLRACHHGAGKAVVGCASAATYAAPRSAGPRGASVDEQESTADSCSPHEPARHAGRTVVGHTLFEHRAQRRCAAASRPREGEFVWPPSRPEHLREPGRRPGAASERRRIPARGFASLPPSQG